jgi:type IV secretory pathway VirB6-like protein
MNSCVDVCKIINCYGVQYSIRRLVGYEDNDCSTIQQPIYQDIVGNNVLLDIKKSGDCNTALMAFCVDSDIVVGDIINVAGIDWIVNNLIVYPSHYEATAGKK